MSAACSQLGAHSDLLGGADADDYGRTCGSNCRSRVPRQRRALAAEPHIADMQVINSDANARFLKLGLKKPW